MGAGSSRELAYDDDGNLVADLWSLSETASFDVQAQERQFTWNAAGCLTSVTADNGDALQAKTEFTCDSSGQTIARRTTAFGAPVSTRVDIMGLGEILPEEGIFLLRIPVGGTVHVEEAWTIGTGERAPERSGYVLNDARGSVLAKTSFSSESPTVNEEAEYDAWGATARISELSAPQHQFTGEEPDPVTGIYHFGVRAYDPSLRRWLSPDPLFLVSPESDAAGGALLNLYAYSANNPVRKIDESGQIPVDTIWDVANVIYDVGKITVGAVTNNPAMVAEGSADLALDLVATAVPYLPAGATKLLKYGDDVVEGAVKYGDEALEQVAKNGDDVGKKLVPNPYGKKGGPAHQGKVDDVVKDMEKRGLDTGTELKVKTPDGEKGSRYVDAYGKDPKTGKVVETHQVGKQTKKGEPIARERRALDDIEGATGKRPDFHPYNFFK